MNCSDGCLKHGVPRGHTSMFLIDCKAASQPACFGSYGARTQWVADTQATPCNLHAWTADGPLLIVSPLHESPCHRPGHASVPHLECCNPLGTLKLALSLQGVGALWTHNPAARTTPHHDSGIMRSRHRSAQQVMVSMKAPFVYTRSCPSLPQSDTPMLALPPQGKFQQARPPQPRPPEAAAHARVLSIHLDGAGQQRQRVLGPGGAPTRQPTNQGVPVCRLQEWWSAITQAGSSSSSMRERQAGQRGPSACDTPATWDDAWPTCGMVCDVYGR
jgi:hypothetical protein